MWYNLPLRLLPLRLMLFIESCTILHLHLCSHNFSKMELLYVRQFKCQFRLQSKIHFSKIKKNCPFLYIAHTRELQYPTDTIIGLYQIRNQVIINIYVFLSNCSVKPSKSNVIYIFFLSSKPSIIFSLVNYIKQKIANKKSTFSG